MRSTQTWTDAVIESLHDVTPTVREFSIRLTGDVQRHEPGSHLQLQLLVNGKPQMRCYSLVGEPDGKTFRIAVKRMDEGLDRKSTRLNSSHIQKSRMPSSA